MKNKILGLKSPIPSDQSPLSWTTHAATWLTLHAFQERPQALQHSIRWPDVPALTGHPVEQERGEVTPRNMHPLEAVAEMLPVHAGRCLRCQHAVGYFGMASIHRNQ